MLKYPSRRKIRHLSIRDRRKHHLSEFQVISRNIKIRLEPTLSQKEIRTFNEEYIEFIENSDIESLCFIEYGEGAEAFHRNFFTSCRYHDSGFTSLSSCKDLEEALVREWLGKRKEVLGIAKIWKVDHHYSYLTWNDEDKKAIISYDLSGHRGKEAMAWYRKWFREVNHCSDCSECHEKLCE